MDKFVQGKKIRIKKKFPHPNPLFEKWLMEWKLEAENKGSKMKYNFQKAIRSLQKFPLPLQSGKDCQILANFGNKICDMIDKKLEEYDKESQQIFSEEDQNKPERMEKKKISGMYIPSPNSGAYALIIALHKECKKKDFLYKEELTDIAQEYCEASFSIPKEGTYYTAWSSMSTLIKKNLVEKTGNPARYHLTAAGKALATLLLSSDSVDSSSCFEKSNFTEKLSENKVRNGIVNCENIIEDEECMIVNDDSLKEAHTEVHNRYLEETKDEKQNKKRKLSEDTESSSTYTRKKSSENCFSENINFTLRPGTFSVVLNVDNTEVFGGSTGGRKSAKEVLTKELGKNGVTFQVRKLSVGDFLWTCQSKDNFGEVKEVVLPFVVERKRMDDLGQSIRDGRFKEQKFRLKQSGLFRPIYLVEEYGASHSIVPLSTCEQAIINTQVTDNFTVRVTKDQKESAAYLTIMTRYLEDKFKRKTLYCVPRNSELFSKEYLCSENIYLQEFKELNSLVAKNRSISIQEMFAKHLLQINGASVDKVSAIVQKYKTPDGFLKALKDNELNSSCKENILCNLKCPKSGRNVDQTLSAQVVRLYTRDVLL